LKETEILSLARQKQVAKIVHCGLPQNSLKLLCLVLPTYGARKIWKKLSTSVVVVNKKLRRLSSVGSTYFLDQIEEGPLCGGLCFGVVGDLTVVFAHYRGLEFINVPRLNEPVSRLPLFDKRLNRKADAA
jgi:hypothetical protein